ncbi:Hemin transport system permease protein HmuU [compost metagenome]
MQGLFRNPLADPGLVGVSSGAALGAAFAIVGAALLGGVPDALSPYLLSICAFGGGLTVTALVYRLGRRDGQTNVATMLLAGIALTALAGAIIGLFTYLADDATLRTLTFWNLGSLNGASYSRLWPLLIVTAGVALWLPRRAKALNALLLGESEARHLGFEVERLKRELVLCTALGVGAAVAAAGLIGFIGLVVPHLVRLLAGPDHRVLLPASALAGASLLLFADLAARLLLAPAELPIGIVTALIGAPFFIYLLVRGRA